MLVACACNLPEDTPKINSMPGQVALFDGLISCSNSRLIGGAPMLRLHSCLRIH